MAEDTLFAGSARHWSGKPVSKQEMLGLLRKFLTPEKMAGPVHYVYTMDRDEKRRKRMYLLRLCWFIAETPFRCAASFDGVPGEREFHNGEIFAGGYNSVNTMIHPERAVYGGFTLVFHLHHVRLHYCFFRYGKEETNCFYHTLKPADGVLLQMVKALDMLIREPSPDKDERVKLLIEAIGKQVLFEQENEAEEKADTIARRIKILMDHNFHCGIDCSLICEALHVNRSYASKLFHESYHVTMTEYLQSLRIHAVKQLLKNEQKLTLEEISVACGFTRPGYMIRLFRKHTGMTPGEFRNGN